MRQTKQIKSSMYRLVEVVCVCLKLYQFVYSLLLSYNKVV